MGRERARGFTLIELLVAIAIISLLITIVTTVGAAAISGGRARQTQDTIRTVDSAVATYLNDVGTIPPAFIAGFAPDVTPPFFEGDDTAAYPLIDGVDLTRGEQDRTVVNSIGLFMRALDEVGLGETLSSVPAEVLTRWDGDGNLVDEANGTVLAQGTPGTQAEMRTILDGWGRPLRFVHPAWDGLVTFEDNQGNARGIGMMGTSVTPIAQDDASFTENTWLSARKAPLGYDPSVDTDFPIRLVRRDFISEQDRTNWSGTGAPIGDSDGGYAVGNVPYIYSAGKDGDPSTLDGNVYTVEPRRPVIPTFDCSPVPATVLAEWPSGPFRIRTADSTC